MARVVFRLADELSVSPAPAEGPRACRLSRAGSSASAVLERGAAAILLLVDGKRTADEIEFLARQAGLQVPDGQVERMLQALVRAGLVLGVEAPDRPIAMLPGDAFECRRCGQACVVHWVGPLHPPEMERIRTMHAALAGRHPRLASVRPFRAPKGGADDRFLNLGDGACVYLDSDGLCLIHKEFGIAAKPDICRLFPHTRIEDRDASRIVASPSCFKLHVGLRRVPGPPVAVDPATVEGRFPPSFLRFNPVPDAVAGLEDAVVEALGRPDATILGVAALLARERHPRMEFPRLAARVLRRAAPKYVRDSFLDEAQRHGSPFALRVRDITGFLKTLDAERGKPRCPPLTRQWEDYLLDSLRRMVFAREYLCFAGIEPATAAWLACAWASGCIVERNPGLATDEARYDRFGELMATWYRTFWFGPRNERVFSSASEAQDLLAAVGRGWPSR